MDLLQKAMRHRMNVNSHDVMYSKSTLDSNLSENRHGEKTLNESVAYGVIIRYLGQECLRYIFNS